MSENKSPWLHNLEIKRKITTISKDEKTDVVIVGAGIAGVSTAFFILKNTNKKVILLEASKVAHGATGHNGGHIVSYFEKQFYSLVNDFGLKMATDGQKAIEEDGWRLLDEMYSDADLSIHLSRFVGYTGIVSFSHFLEAIENNQCRKQGGLRLEKLSISEEAPFLDKIQSEFKDMYEIVPKQTILDALETEDDKYVAMLSFQKGVANSALLCNQVVDFLLKKYQERFVLFENTPVEKVVLKTDSVLVDAISHTVESEKIILCTNGFEKLEIFSEDGLDVNKYFHEQVEGYVGYMSGYLEKMNKQPTALSYIDDESVSLSNKDLHYFYLTRRPFEYEKGVDHNLISLGGPGNFVPEDYVYDRNSRFPEKYANEINLFLENTYKLSPNKKVDEVFNWHGLMGFTKNMIRLIGESKKHPRLLYNLGCNGVGLLPSIYGGWKVAEIINGKKFPQSIFDPN